MAAPVAIKRAADLNEKGYMALSERVTLTASEDTYACAVLGLVP